VGLKQGVGGLRQQMNGLERDNKILKEDIKQVDLKIEIVNNNLKRTENDIITQITYLYENAGIQEEIDKLKHRVKSLEEKVGVHN
jgi:predicted  nucleic acid-binding Zn-ribbon protein